MRNVQIIKPTVFFDASENVNGTDTVVYQMVHSTSRIVSTPAGNIYGLSRQFSYALRKSLLQTGSFEAFEPIVGNIK